MRTLRRGATGEDVKVLQSSLLSLGYDPGPIDGIFGAKTVAAVVQFQQKNGLVPDGIVGPITWGHIQRLTTAPGTYIIQSGDTFYKIALANNISLSALIAANPSVDPTKLMVGQVIKIPAITNNWPIAGGDPSNTNFAPVSLPLNFSLIDKPVVDVSGYVSPFAVFGGRIYTVDRINTQKLYAIDLASNTIQWDFTTEGTQNPITGIAVVNAIAYLITANKLYALQDQGAGSVTVWSTVTGGSYMTYTPSSIIYFENQSGRIVSLNLNTGALQWSYSLQPRFSVEGKMALGGGKLFVTQKNPIDMYFQLLALDSGTGQIIWTRNLGSSGVMSTGSPVYKDDKLYLDLDKSLYAFVAQTGSPLWNYNANTDFYFFRKQAIGINDQSIFILNYYDGYLIALNKETGAERWKVGYTDGVAKGKAYEPVATIDKVFITYRNSIKIYDANTGILLREFIPIQANNLRLLAIGANRLLVTDGNKLYTLIPS